MINIVTALAAEATPIVQHYRLKRSNQAHPFPVFARDNMQLVVSGIGKCNSAAATAWLAGITSHNKQADSVWINLGIGGNGTEEIGALICASRIIDSATGKSWYPTLINNPIKKTSVETVDTPALNYENGHTYDMEASGFYSSAIKVSTSELIQSFKVISDNTDHAVSQVTARLATDLIGACLHTLDTQIEVLSALSGESEIIESTSVEQAFHGQIKFTTAQKNQLRRLLHRHVAILGNYEVALETLDNTSTNKSIASEILDDLSTALKR